MPLECMSIFSAQNRWLKYLSKGMHKPWASQVALVVKNPLTNAGNTRDVGSIPELGRSHGGGHGNPLQYSCLENPMDRGAWWATVHAWGRRELDMTEQLTLLTTTHANN